MMNDPDLFDDIITKIKFEKLTRSEQYAQLRRLESLTSGLSWSGPNMACFIVKGDQASIAEVRRLVEFAAARAAPAEGVQPVAPLRDAFVAGLAWMLSNKDSHTRPADWLVAADEWAQRQAPQTPEGE